MSEEQVPAKMLAGFWIRVFADLIDIAVSPTSSRCRVASGTVKVSASARLASRC